MKDCVSSIRIGLRIPTLWELFWVILISVIHLTTLGGTGWEGCGPLLSEGMRCITWKTRGLVGSVFSKQKKREFKLKYLKRLFDANNILCLQEVHGKDEYIQAFQVLAPRFRFFWYFLYWKRKRRRIGYIFKNLSSVPTNPSSGWFGCTEHVAK